jgi:DNA polymerase-3 subunit delta'
MLDQTGSPWAVQGHAWAVHLLQRTLQPTAGPRHAYLFLGPPQVGKSTLAHEFARALLCQNEQARPCGSCRSCGLFHRNTHPDLRWIQPRDKDDKVDRVNGMLKVEQAAEIIHEAALRPVEGRYKIFIIQNVQQANLSFANKLLKTLEEPPDHVVLLLTAADRNSLLPTIVSRCQVLELRPLAVADIERALRIGWQADPTQAALLARLANGRLGWAVQQLSDEAGAAQRQEQLAQLWNLTHAGRVARLAFAEQSAEKRNNQHLFAMLEVWTTWWRDVLLTQVGCPEACCNVDQPDEIARQAAALDVATVRDYLATLQRIEAYLHHTVNTRLALDVLLLRLPTVALSGDPVGPSALTDWLPAAARARMDPTQRTQKFAGRSEAPLARVREEANACCCRHSI